MAKILLVRHGETAWNKEKRVMGHLHIPLNETGMKQAASIAEVLKEVSISAAYSSPLLRAMQTAEAISANHKIAVIEEKRLIEINFGSWNEKYFHELKDDPLYIEFHKTPKYFKVPCGERMEDVFERSISVVEELNKKHEHDTILLVSHCDIIRIILAYYMNLDTNNYRKFYIDNASLSVLDYSSRDNPVISLINYPANIDSII